MTEPMTADEQRNALAALGVPAPLIERALKPQTFTVGGMAVEIDDTRTSSSNYVHIDPRMLRFPIRLVLPWSHLVSDNDKYGATITRHKHGGTFPRLILTSEYRDAKLKARAVARVAMTVDGLLFAPLERPLRLLARVWVPNNRVHDVVNFSKCCHDALEGAVYTKDSWLHDVQWQKAGVDVDHPRAEITIEPL